jgi:hypothetical protein
MSKNFFPESLKISYRPVLFAGLLNHWGHLDPAEIPAKLFDVSAYGTN